MEHTEVAMPRFFRQYLFTLPESDDPESDLKGQLEVYFNQGDDTFVVESILEILAVRRGR